MNKKILSKNLENSCEAIFDWIYQQEDQRFSMGPDGKWDTSQHLDHLIRTTKAVIKGLKIPKFFMRYKFGRPNRPLRMRDEIVLRYKEKLQNLATGFASPLGVEKHAVSQKQDVLNVFKKDNALLIKTISKWSESNLDDYLLPHPLLGRMIIRELIMWTSYHHDHHLKILKEKY